MSDRSNQWELDEFVNVKMPDGKVVKCELFGFAMIDDGDISMNVAINAEQLLPQSSDPYEHLLVIPQSEKGKTVRDAEEWDLSDVWDALGGDRIVAKYANKTIPLSQIAKIYNWNTGNDLVVRSPQTDLDDAKADLAALMAKREELDKQIASIQRTVATLAKRLSA